MNILEADSINLSFGNRKILSNVYLQCGRGDVVGIIGRNGSGKSSLMKLIFGTLRGENQSIRVNKQYVDQLFKYPGVINYLPQDSFLMNYLTVKQVSSIFDADQILNIEILKPHINIRIGELSGGLKKLVEILTMLYTQSKFVLLDEPFSFLSPVLVEEVSTHIKLQSGKKGIMLTDHQYQSVWGVANKYYILYDGILREIYQQDELEQYGYLSRS